jgi:hypothetical protein
VGAELVAQPVELGGGGHGDAHELRLVEHPEAVAVEKPEVDGPAAAPGRVPPIEGAGEEHVDGADQDGRSLGVACPVAHGPDLAAHQEMASDVVVGEAEPVEGRGDDAPHLLDQDAHGQCVDQPARRGLADIGLREEPAVEPCQQDRLGLAGARRRADDRWQIGAGGQAYLIRVRLAAGGLPEQVAMSDHGGQ